MTIEDIVPSNLNSAIEILYASIGEEDIEWMKTADASTAQLHHTLGRQIRNAWSLWDKETHLVRYFQSEFDIMHADDISGLILTGLIKTVRRESFDPYEEVKVYHKHWFSQGIDPKTMEKLI